MSNSPRQKEESLIDFCGMILDRPVRRKDMKEHSCLVTGATSGIGKAVSFELSRLGHRLILIGRNEGRLKKTVREIGGETGNTKISSCRCDLSTLREVRRAAERIKRDHSKIDVLINNAGAKILRHQLTEEGIERTLATNHLGHFLLTILLMDLLEASGEARVINVSSGTHFNGSGVIGNIQSVVEYDGRKQYAESKLANVLFTYALADRLKDKGISVNAMTPGGVATKFSRNNGLRHWLKHLAYHWLKGQLRTPAQGAETIVYLAISDEVAGLTGRYFEDKKEAKSSAVSYERTIQEALWRVSVALSGIDL